MARTTLESIQHAIEVNSSLALPIALENLSRLTHLALLTVPFNLIHILVFSLKDFRPDLGHQLWRQEIMYAHGAMALLFGGIGLLALWLRRQPPKLWRMRLLILLGGAGIIGFGVAIACIDQRITSNITPLLLACFACAMFILIRPAYAVPFYGLAMLVFQLAMGYAQADPQLRLSNQANGLTAFGLGPDRVKTQQTMT
ncbi:TPA: diguanylate cyclase RoeA, partial [Pseudomonas aeruginosa]|nr:diguanylate cyclase RoeA [Pseudomonas aeruginosa]